MGRALNRSFSRLDLPHDTARREFAWRALTVVTILALFAIAWYVAEVLLLAFAGILLAVFLDFLARKVSELTPLGRGWSFAAVAIALSLLLALAVWQALPRVIEQVNQLIQALPTAFDRLRAYLSASDWGRTVLEWLPSMIGSANLVGKATAAVSRAFDGLAAVVVVAVVGLYIGANPGIYHRGLLKLFPEERRAAADEVLSEVAYTLRWWVLGQLVPMAVLGLASMVGLRLLRIPLAFTLGLFTGFMIFIPYIGALIALAVTMLVALIQGPMQVLYAAILFLGIHIAEGYLLTPMVQKRAVHLPPALTILAQVLMGILLGFPGLALATPITAAALVLVQMLYLRERPSHHG